MDRQKFWSWWACCILQGGSFTRKKLPTIQFSRKRWPHSGQSDAHTSTLKTRAIFFAKPQTLAQFWHSFEYFKIWLVDSKWTKVHWVVQLRLGYVTAEKQAPSPISILADISEAIKIHRRLSPGKVPLRDAMTKVIAEYNRIVTVRRHRVDSARRSLIYNLLLGQNFDGFELVILSRCIFILLRLRCPNEVLSLLHSHYDQFPHQSSGLWIFHFFCDDG